VFYCIECGGQIKCDEQCSLTAVHVTVGVIDNLTLFKFVVPVK